MEGYKNNMKIGYKNYYKRIGNDTYEIDNINGKILGVSWTANTTEYLYFAGYNFNLFNPETGRVEYNLCRGTKAQGENKYSWINSIGILHDNIYRYDLPNPYDPLFSTVEHNPYNEDGSLKENLLNEQDLFFKHIFKGALGFGIPFEKLFLDLIKDKENLTEII